MDENIRYSVELDSSAVRGELQGIESSITGGLNTAFGGISGGMGIVSSADQALRRDLSTFFSPPSAMSAYYGGMSTNTLAMQMGGGVMQPPAMGYGMPGMARGDQGSQLGFFREMDISALGSAFHTAARGWGNMLRGAGFQTRLGAEPRTMTTERYEELAKESLGERTEELWGGLKSHGAVMGLSTAASIAAAAVFSTPVGWAVGGSILAADLLGYDMFENRMAQIVDPGRQSREMGRALRGTRLGGTGGAYGKAMREEMGQAAINAASDTAFRNFMKPGEAGEVLGAAIEIGVIDRQKMNRTAESFQKEVKDMYGLYKKVMQTMHVEQEEALSYMARMKQQFGTTAAQSNQIMSGVEKLAAQTGMTVGGAYARTEALSSNLQQLGVGGPESVTMAARQLSWANSAILTGMVDPETAGRMGGAVGVGAIPTMAQAQFQRTGLGSALTMARYVGGGQGDALAADLRAGRASINQALAPLGEMSLGKFLTYKGQEADIMRRGLGDQDSAAAAWSLLGELNEKPDAYKAAGLMVQAFGMDSDIALVIAKEYQRNLTTMENLSIAQSEQDRAASLDKRIRLRSGNSGVSEKWLGLSGYANPITAAKSQTIAQSVISKDIIDKAVVSRTERLRKSVDAKMQAERIKTPGKQFSKADMDKFIRQVSKEQNLSSYMLTENELSELEGQDLDINERQNRKMSEDILEGATNSLLAVSEDYGLLTGDKIDRGIKRGNLASGIIGKKLDEETTKGLFGSVYTRKSITGLSALPKEEQFAALATALGSGKDTKKSKAMMKVLAESGTMGGLTISAMEAYERLAERANISVEKAVAGKKFSSADVEAELKSIVGAGGYGMDVEAITQKLGSVSADLVLNLTKAQGDQDLVRNMALESAQREGLKANAQSYEDRMEKTLDNLNVTLKAMTAQLASMED